MQTRYIVTYQAPLTKIAAVMRACDLGITDVTTRRAQIVTVETTDAPTAEQERAIVAAFERAGAYDVRLWRAR